jgi:hypothetical protein
MSNWKSKEPSTFINKQSCDRLKKEWLSKLREREIPSSIYTAKIGDIFTYQETGDNIRHFCIKANARDEFSTGK